MKLLDVWRSKAYDERADKSQLQPIWNTYFAKEKDILADYPQPYLDMYGLMPQSLSSTDDKPI